MAKTSLRWACEQYGIELCRTHSHLKGKKMRHSDDAKEAEKNCLVFTATVGEHDLSGTPHFHVDLEIESRSDGTPEQNDAVIGAVYESFLTAETGKTVAERLFTSTGYLRIEDEMSQERADTKSLRVTKIHIPLRARLGPYGDTSPVMATS